MRISDWSSDVCSSDLGLKQATSLKLETGRDFLLKPLLAGIFHSLEARYLQLRGGAREQLRKAYLDQLLGYDRPRLFRLVQGPAKHREAGILSDIPDAFEGVIRGVSPEGRLLVETNGCIQSFDKKEIEFLF